MSTLASSPFSRRTLVIIIGVVAVSLGAVVALTVFGTSLADSQSAGAHGYSTSAIGHRGLVKMLQKLDVPVIVSRANSPEKAKHGLLVICEPTVTDQGSVARLKALLDSEVPTLIVLPKWYGQAERGKKWLADASFIPRDEVVPIFDVIGVKADISRAGSASLAFRGDPMAAQPSIREPQLITSEAIQPQIVAGTDILLGTVDVRDRLWLLSDPDVLNNYGLRNPDNARFTIALIDQLRAGGPVVIDETMHGYAQQPSLLKTLFRFPLVLATMQVLVCALLTIWAAMVTFGPRRGAPPPLAPGKDFLVRNTAALLQYGGHHKHALGRYLQLTIGEVRRTLHAPVLGPAETIAWLERVREARKGKTSLRELQLAVESANTPQRVVEVANQVFRWRMEMTHGTDTRS